MGEIPGDIPSVTPKTSVKKSKPPTLSYVLLDNMTMYVRGRTLTLNCRPDDVVIAVMGVTGAGKSTFISLFAKDAQIGHGLQSCMCQTAYLTGHKIQKLSQS